jgi:Xaa-Pro aminopeptidase
MEASGMQSPSIAITSEEYRSRLEHLLEHLETKQLTGAIMFDRDYILYYTGFAFIPTERPIALVVNAEGKKVLFVPQLERAHASDDAVVDRVAFYVEYPYKPRPMQVFKNLLAEMGVEGKFGADQNGYPLMFGYRGPSLSELTGTTPKSLSDFIEDQMMVKSEAELRLMRESIKWAHFALVLLQRYTGVGASETEVSMRASTEATLAMLDAIGPLYRTQSYFADGAKAVYRGQVGRHSAIPHALANNIRFQAGDVLVGESNAPVWGYNSELERTMIVGPPSDRQKEVFEHMLALQEAAFEMMGPGVSCADVDRAVRIYYQKHDLQPYWRHHVGHSIGLRYHEGPFLDLGDATVMEPGMVFTVEPGLYLPGLGGFRHSDMVVITDDGAELMTYYPRDLKSLTIPT